MTKLYAVRDVKAESFGAPMEEVTEGIALRAFIEACCNPKSDLNRYPADYMLYEVGEYDRNSGLITALPIPKFIMSATEAIAASRKSPVEADVTKEVEA